MQPPFDEAALRRGASSTMRSDRWRLLYVGFRFGFGSTVRLHIFSVLNVNVAIMHFDHRLLQNDFFII